ncbi:MAG: type II toxin-antitoxin system RelE/ParE family toxin [Chloroflexi bacterium]|nr:type II toxin-antitoxin system RelE/ParE family toxin [Chloroflexota bacterium]
MAYKVEILHPAQKQMLSLPKEAQVEISAAIDRFKETPRPVGCKKLRETGLWRTRVGRYRVIYSIDDGANLATIVKVATRRQDTYKGL